MPPNLVSSECSRVVSLWNGSVVKIDAGKRDKNNVMYYNTGNSRFVLYYIMYSSPTGGILFSPLGILFPSSLPRHQSSFGDSRQQIFDFVWHILVWNRRLQPKQHLRTPSTRRCKRTVDSR